MPSSPRQRRSFFPFRRHRTLAMPASPVGFFWQQLRDEHASDLRHFWKLLAEHGEQTRLWQSWSGSLIDCASGRFAPGYLQLFGLYGNGFELVALAAESESPANRAASEITFAVAPDWQGQRLGRPVLEAALALARHRGSDLASLEFHPDNRACLALCRVRGLTPSPHGASLRVDIPLRWWNRCLSFFR